MRIWRALTAVSLLVSALVVVSTAAQPAPAGAVDQLTQLTNFYNANDESKGYVDLSQTDVSYLRAAQASFGGTGLTENGDSQAYVHGFPVSGWNSTSQSFSWVVNNPTAGAYVTNVLIANGSGTIQVSDGSSTVSHTYSGTDTGYALNGWNKLSYGQITVPSGMSTISIAATSTTGANMSLLSLEVYPASISTSLNAAIAAGKSQSTWMKNSPLGVMYQWGQWGAYSNGTEPAWPTVYANADFNALAARDKAMGASYVVWSITWTQYYVAAPISSIDSVLAGRTTTHDYLADMLNAFHNHGMRVIFYYHDGHDSNPDASWWNAFWGVSSSGYYAQKAAAINRWLNITAEIGNRYGTLLDGWLFDDGATYYPAPYSLVNSALRAGNADRMISFNPNGNGPRLTDYEDYAFGEQNDGTWFPTDSNGTITTGAFAGEQNFGNLQEDCGDWGVRTGDTAAITPCRSTYNLTSIAQKAAAEHASVAVDQRMWSDLSQSQDSVAELTAAGQITQADYPTSTIDDSNSAVTYTGAWQNSNSGGCYNNTCHNIQATGATAQYTFTGSSITWNSITSTDQGQADVYIDGVFNQTVNLYAPSRSVGVPVYTHGLPYGSHTIKIVTDNASWVTVDSFTVGTANVVDDSASAVTYTGSWGNSDAGGCYNKTCHNANATGSTATVSFNGTGISWNSITGPDQGSASVSVDGGASQTVNLYASDRSVGVPVFTARGLPSGSHTLKITTQNTNWVTVDSFIVETNQTIDDSSSAISYDASWQNSNPGGCYNNTCHNADTTGATATLTFTGTGVTWNAITSWDQGQADVYIDGVLDQTINLYNAVRTVGTPIYSRFGLTPSSHTLKIVTKNTNWVSIDSFSVSS